MSRPGRAAGGRRVLVLLLAAALATSAAACGGDDGDEPEGAATDPAPAAEDGAFPVTIEHTYGETEVEAAPERVVTVGLTDQDPLLALGVAPVGVTDWFGDHPYAAFPWAVEALGDAEPTIVGDTGDINFEQIAALRPDLILAVYAGLTEDEFATLSQIAPTVAQPGEYNDYGVPWDEQTITIGRAVGRAAEAEALVADVEERFAAAREEHPEFAGATGIVATPYQGTIFVYSPEDPRGRFMEALGFASVPEIDDLVTDGFGAELSMEQADLLDVDALVWIIDDPVANMAELHDVELYGRMAVAEDGREVPVVNLSELGSATSFQTVLSLPALLDGLVPMLAAAVDGDPGTEVAQPGE